jgi:hypothetical protein
MGLENYMLPKVTLKEKNKEFDTQLKILA